MSLSTETYEYNVVAYIGRFQPVHNGHLAMLQRALELAPKVVVVMGSSFQGRTPKNPFTWQEREEMFRAALPEDVQGRVTFVPVRDYYDNKRWSQAVRTAVESVTARGVGLIGHFKDASSQYLNLFPGWSLVDMPRLSADDASQVRRVMFDTPPEARKQIFALVAKQVPTGVLHYLQAWWGLGFAQQLHEDTNVLADYRAKYGKGPFDAADAVVRCNDKVLLIRRGKAPFKGAYALPGGFLDEDERFYDAAVRELAEETGLHLVGGLDNYFVRSAMFDHPGRSLRARIKSMAHYFDLRNCKEPEVRAADDAQPGSAQWVLIADLAAMEDQFFEDHFHCLDEFFNLTGTERGAHA